MCVPVFWFCLQLWEKHRVNVSTMGDSHGVPGTYILHSWGQCGMPIVCQEKQYCIHTYDNY